MGSLGLGLGATHVHFESTLLPLPILSSSPTVTGYGIEATPLLSDETDAWSYDGSRATVTARAYRLVLDGSVAVGPQSAASITIPDGTGGQSYSYELRVTVTEGGDAQSAWTPLAAGNVSDVLDLIQTADGEVEIDHTTGTVTVTITSPSWYANYDAGNGPGVLTFDSALLDTGPVNLVPPLIKSTTDSHSSGTTSEGDTVGIGDPASSTSYPGLWVYDPDVGGLGAASYQWQADAGGDGNFTNLSGATSATYTLTSSEGGDDVRVQETLADNGGSRTVSSVAISVETASPTTTPTVTLVGSATGNDQLTTFAPTFDLSGRSAGDRLLIFFGMFAQARDATISVNNNAATLAQASGTSVNYRGLVTYEYVLQATDLDGSVNPVTAVPIVATLLAAQNHDMMAVVATGGTIEATDTGAHLDGAEDTYSLPTNDASANAVLVALVGRDAGLRPSSDIAVPADFSLLLDVDIYFSAMSIFLATNHDTTGGVPVSTIAGQDALGTGILLE